MENEYIRIFKNIFEYHTNGMLNNKEFGQLMDMIYYFRFDQEKLKDIKPNKNVELAWNAIKPTMATQKRNANNYKNKKNKDAYLEEHEFGQGTEVEINN